MKDLIGRRAAHSIVTQLKNELSSHFPSTLWEKVIAIYVVGSYARGYANKLSDLDIWIWADAYQHDQSMFPDKTPRLIARILAPTEFKVNTLVAHDVPLDITVYEYHPLAGYSQEVIYYNDKYEFV